VGGSKGLGIYTDNESELQCEVPSVAQEPTRSSASEGKEGHSIPVLPAEDRIYPYWYVFKMDRKPRRRYVLVVSPNRGLSNT